MRLPLVYPKAYVGYKHYDKDGILIKEYYGEAHSFVNNFYHFLSAVSGYAVLSTLNGNRIQLASAEYTGSRFLIQSNYMFAWCYLSISSKIIGIRVGTGNSAETLETYDLDAPVEEGTGAGELTHTLISRVNAIDGTIRKCTHSRTFTNNSGGTIAIEEIGLRGTLAINPTAGGFYLIRDLLSISMAAGDSLYAEYVLQLDFGA